MALFIRGGIAELYFGAAADTKPTGVPPGSYCYAYDTGQWFVTNDGTNWRQVGPGHNITGIGDGRKIVTTAATRVALAASTPAKVVTITAETDNTGIIVVGGATVVAALATRQGTPLYAGESVTLLCDDLADIYLDSTVSGDGVTYLYLS